jgi:iron complex outermembrane receptor protein
VPKVRSTGAEIDARAQVTDGLSLTASGVFDEAYYESDPSGPCPYELSNAAKSCNLTARPLAGASKWTGSFGGEYDYPLPEIYNRHTVAYFGGNVLLRTGFYSTGDDSSYSYVPGYMVGNITFGVRQINGG